jgi:Uma2 family endonuclease
MVCTACDRRPFDYPMNGAAHSRVVWNLAARLDRVVSSCQGFTGDMQIRAGNSEVRADVAMVCGIPQFHDEKREILVNPTVIFEVTSRKTEACDRGSKFASYQSIESVAEYVVVCSDRVRVDVFRRQPDGQWLMNYASRMEEVVELQSIGCRLALADLYENVELA